MLDEAGVILECDGDTEAMFGYSHENLISRHVSLLLPKLQSIELMAGGRLNPRLHYLCRVGLPFQVRRRDKERYLSYLSLTDLSNVEKRRVRLCIRRSHY